MKKSICIFEQIVYRIAFDGWAIYNGVIQHEVGLYSEKTFRGGVPIFKICSEKDSNQEYYL